MVDTLKGEINEVRRIYKGENGDVGTVHFTRVWRHGKDNPVSLTDAKVTLSNGRQGWVRYKSAKEVLLHLNRRKKK